MQSHIIRVIIIILGLMLIIPVLNNQNIIKAEETKNPNIVANFDILFKTGTELLINVTISVNSITTDATYTKEDIKKIQDPYAIGAIEYALYLDLRDQITNMFRNDTILNFTRPRYINEYFRESLNVKLSNSFFKLNNTINVESFINGMLDVDAIILYTFDFQASSGWNNTFQIILPESMTYHSTNGRVNNRIIIWELYNYDGKKPNLKGTLSLKYTKPTTPKSETENITLNFILDTSSIQKNKLNVMINTYSINIKPYNILPNVISNVEVVPSDCIRLLVENHILSWENIYQRTIKTIEDKTQKALEISSLNQTVTLSFKWDASTTTNCSDPYKTNSMDNEPQIIATLTDDDVDIRFMGITSRGFYGLINAGAFADIKKGDLNFGDKLETIGYPYTCKLILPQGISVNNKNIYEWGMNDNITGSFTSDKAPTYSTEEKQVSVDIHLTKMDLNIQSFIIGKKELTTPIQSRETVEIHVTTIPEGIKLPERIYITHLNSDALRLCIEEKIFTETQIDILLESYKQLFEQRINKIIPNVKTTGYIDKNIFNESLQWDGDISKMDSKNPVKISSYSNSICNIPFNLSLYPSSFNITNHEFTLYGLEESSITYRIIYPLGIKITVEDTEQKNIITGETENGEQYIQLSFKPKECLEGDRITCRLEASTIFLLGTFLPCIISIILFIILIIVLILLSRRRGGLLRSLKRGRVKKAKERKTVKMEEEPESEEEPPEYYIPPPPTRRL
ncbi:MAG: hypothetical protein QXS02_01465 [Candidatus Thermoplasmatota archaeon]